MWKKKTLFLVVTLFFLFLGTIRADEAQPYPPGGLIGTHTNIANTNITLARDYDDTTYQQFTVSEATHLYAIFDVPVTIIGAYLHYESPSVTPSIYFYDVNNNLIATMRGQQDPGDDYKSDFRLLSTNDIVSQLDGVKRIATSSGGITTAWYRVFEMDVISEPIDTTPPDAPTNVSAVVGDGEAIVTWDPVPDSNIIGYNVYVDGVKHNAEPIAQTNYTVTGLTTNEEYEITVTALNFYHIESLPSSPITVIPEGPPLPDNQPKNVRVVARNEAVLISWSAVQDATEYIIYRDGVQVGTTTTTNYLDEHLTNGTTYTYTISAVVDGIEGEPSDPVKAQPNASIQFEGAGHPGVLDTIKTAFNFANLFSSWKTLVLGILFVPAIVGFVFWLVYKMHKKPERKPLNVGRDRDSKNEKLAEKREQTRNQEMREERSARKSSRDGESSNIPSWGVGGYRLRNRKRGLNWNRSELTASRTSREIREERPQTRATRPQRSVRRGRE